MQLMIIVDSTYRAQIILQNKNSVYCHTPFMHIYIIHIDIHTICGHRNCLPRFVKVLPEEESLGF